MVFGTICGGPQKSRTHFMGIKILSSEFFMDCDANLLAMRECHFNNNNRICICEIPKSIDVNTIYLLSQELFLLL